MKPLDGLLVLEFCQFLAGPSAALRLADLGARVIKIERPDGGDIGRTLYNSNLEFDGDSTLFHSINRNKQSFAVNLKDRAEFGKIKKLIEKADVLIENFRPGVVERMGIDYASVSKINPRLIYGEITGYGNEGPWRNKPGQDLLVQSVSGITWLNGNADQPPTPFGLAIVDLFTSAHLIQGILAALVRRGITGKGAFVQVSLLESILDFQFEVITTHLNDNGALPQRSTINSAHAYLAAPYGIYATADGHIALAMGSILDLASLLDCPALLAYADRKTWFSQRDEIKQILVDHLRMQPTDYWLARLEPADYWCADVLTWTRLLQHDGFQVLNMIQQVWRTGLDTPLPTTRCPIRIDGELLLSDKGAPRVGEDTDKITTEFQLA
ncbi:MAG: CoA transferase [Anaerolineae bacterium]|nr:CoA transferase [Anaerolineae bacterium]